jgi:hypothetical protein
VASIGGTEIDHFSLWHDKVSGALTGVTDPVTGLTFPDLGSNTAELMQPNLILPEPTRFISSSLPLMSIIRPSSPKNSRAVAAVKAFTADNLFDGQPPEFFRLMRLAVKADAARRQVSASKHRTYLKAAPDHAICGFDQRPRWSPGGASSDRSSFGGYATPSLTAAA